MLVDYPNNLSKKINIIYLTMELFSNLIIFTIVIFQNKVNKTGLIMKFTLKL